MRTLLLSAIILGLATATSAQNFGATGAQWHYSAHADGLCPGNCEYIHFQSVLDTVINGQPVNKITQTYYRYWGDTLYLDPIYLYEQSDTVFMWDFERERFLTTYIFNGAVGDTLVLDAPELLEWTDTIYRLVITAITDVTVDGVTLKKYETLALDGFEFFNGGFFMDRIGGLDYFFPRPPVILEAPGPIRCYSDAEIDTSFQPVACDHVLISSVDDMTANEGITAHPNPSTGPFTLTWQSTTAAAYAFTLYDAQGREAYAHDGHTVSGTTTVQLQLAHLPAGIYFGRLAADDGIRHFKWVRE
jgi:hypothetical protein